MTPDTVPFPRRASPLQSATKLVAVSGESVTPPLKTRTLLAGKACLSFQAVIKRLGLTVVGHGRVANTSGRGGL